MERPMYEAIHLEVDKVVAVGFSEEANRFGITLNAEGNDYSFALTREQANRLIGTIAHINQNVLISDQKKPKEQSPLPDGIQVLGIVQVGRAKDGQYTEFTVETRSQKLRLMLLPEHSELLATSLQKANIDAFNARLPLDRSAQIVQPASETDFSSNEIRAQISADGAAIRLIVSGPGGVLPAILLPIEAVPEIQKALREARAESDKIRRRSKPQRLQ